MTLKQEIRKEVKEGLPVGFKESVRKDEITDKILSLVKKYIDSETIFEVLLKCVEEDLMDSIFCDRIAKLIRKQILKNTIGK